MRIISVTQTNTALRVVAEEGAGQIREFVFGEDDDGTIVMHWGDIDTDPEIETFSPVDMPPIIRLGEWEKQDAKCVEWLNISFPEAINWHHSGKWVIEYFTSKLGWCPFDGHKVMPDGTVFRAKPKPGSHG